jgi:hypothetical protein
VCSSDLLLFLILFLAQLDTRTHYFYTKLLCAGLFLGIASLIRPVGLYVLVLDALMLAISSRKISTLIKAFGALSLGWLVIVLPWLIRNFLLTGYIFFHTLPGLHFLQFTATQAYMDMHACSYLHAREQLLKELDTQIDKQHIKTHDILHNIQCCQIAEQITAHYIKERPLAIIKHALVQVLKTIFALHSTHILYIDQGWPEYNEHTTLWDKVKTYIAPQVSGPFIIFLIYFDMLSLFLLLAGFLLFLSQIFRQKALFIVALKTLPFIGLFIAITLAYGCARLRTPIEPLLIILALVGWGALFTQKSRTLIT